MRNGHVGGIGAAWLVAVAIAAIPTAAQAAKCERSCTAVKNVCVQMGASESACAADLANCLKTGSLHMPSGRTFSNLCKR